MAAPAVFSGEEPLYQAIASHGKNLAEPTFSASVSSIEKPFLVLQVAQPPVNSFLRLLL